MSWRKETRLNLLVVAGLLALAVTAQLCGYDIWNNTQSRWLLLRVYVVVAFVTWLARSNAGVRATLGSGVLKWMVAGVVFLVFLVIFTVILFLPVESDASHQSLAAVTPTLKSLLVAFVPYLAAIPAGIALGLRLDEFHPASRVPYL